MTATAASAANGAPTASPPCPLAFSLGLFGDRWTLSVLRDVLIEGLSRYNELLAANPGLATNILANRLKRLERDGFLRKARDPDDARRYVYRPTEAAIGVVPMILEMLVWGARHGQGELPRGFLARFDRDRDGLLDQLQRRIRENAGLPQATLAEAIRPV